MLMGACQANRFSLNNEDNKDRLGDMITICRESVRTGSDFIAYVETLWRRGGYDIIYADPLMAFLGADISDIRVVSPFLRNNLNAFLQRSRCAWVWALRPKNISEIKL